MKGLNPGQPVVTAKELGRRFGERTILKGASFSLMPGDRVGVLGVNGVGKSTLMKILAGRDKEYDGHLHIARGATVGYVSQEPELDFDKSVRENVEYSVGEVRALLARYDEILKTWEDPAVMEDEERMNALLEEQGDVQGQLEALDAMDPAALDNRYRVAFGGGASPGVSLQGTSRPSRRAHPGRTDKPPRRRYGRVARDFLGRLFRHVRARDP